MYCLTTVKAGSVDDFSFRYGGTFHHYKYVRVNGRAVDVSTLKRFAVSGDSMTDYAIHSGQQVFVRPISVDEAQVLDKRPILVFHMKPKNIIDSKFKLRKFLGYVDLESCNSEDVFNLYEQDIKLTKDEFINEYNARLQKLTADGAMFKGKYILSATYRTKEKKYHYSLHKSDNVFGVVEYVL